MSVLWDQVFNHDAVKEHLLSAVRHNRLAATHIFVGPPGVGKGAMAMAMAQNLLCEQPNGVVACGQCPPCIRVARGKSESVLVVSPSGANIKIDQARQVVKFLNLQCLGRARVIIVDEAERFNPQAANALLKSLEEPPEQTYFFLVTRNLSALLPTIRSRSQVLRFGPLSRDLLVRLSGRDDWVVDAAQGSMELVDFLSDPDKAAVRESASKWWDLALSGDGHGAMDAVKDVCRDREMSALGSRYFQQFIRDARVMRSGSGDLLHRDLLPLVEKLSSYNDELLDELSQRAYRLEGEIAGQLERSLCYQNYFLGLADLLELNHE